MIENTVFSDIDMSLGLNINNDIAKKLNENAIKQSLKNIIMTRHKLFKPNFGPGVEESLFELIDPVSVSILSSDISEAIKRWEPRIQSIKVKIDEAKIDENELVLDIYFKIRDNKEIYSTKIILEVLK